ncbi:hypothetical protein N8I74_00500 [Chitiniphilus purpureus]|uniref:VOC family protein n=1 Tax=Chitiniphilus purpureus TaxID=2981137 RepID=A0ABY6DMD4_9NEIS|nr:hypothetical protein [Chitiniphilus sp. CD1]UXY15530.1 hypothetical protein N8I74_00500 [Chitiniphilus sp. CD1]
MGLHTFQILGVSSRKLGRLQQTLSQSGFDVIPTATGFRITAPDVSGHLFYNPATYTLSVDLHAIPVPTSPGGMVGLIYDQISSLPDM